MGVVTSSVSWYPVDSDMHGTATIWVNKCDGFFTIDLMGLRTTKETGF